VDPGECEEQTLASARWEDLMMLSMALGNSWLRSNSEFSGPVQDAIDRINRLLKWRLGRRSE
jgi:hypothetical protein